MSNQSAYFNHLQSVVNCAKDNSSIGNCAGLISPLRASKVIDGLERRAAIPQYGGMKESCDLWSLWQGNLDAEIMIVGQDWGSVNSLFKCCDDNYVFDPHKAPNDRTSPKLCGLLGSIGVDIAEPNDRVPTQKIYCTNLVQCLRKDGGDQRQIVGGNLTRCSNDCSKHFFNLISIVQPKVAIALGETAFNSILRSLKKNDEEFKKDWRDCRKMIIGEAKEEKKKLGEKFYSLNYKHIVDENYHRGNTEAINERYHLDDDGRKHVLPIMLNKNTATPTALFPVFHCGSIGTNINRNETEQSKDWQKIKRYLDEHPS